MLKIKLDNSISLIHRVKILLKKTEELHLELNGVKNAIDELDEGGFAQLKHLQVQNGHELLYVVSVVPSKTVFPRLEHLFSFSEYKKFSQLQEIEVIDCKNLKEIFGEESVDLVVENARNIKLEFTPLRSLVLQCLPQFIKFGMKVVLPRLENLTLSSTKIEDIWLGQPQLMSSFQCLKILTVEECNGLKFLFSSSMVKSFMQLQKLVICKCKSMEAVILDSEGLEVQDKIIDMSFPKLFYLKLACLPKLTRFGTGNSAEFPTLNELHIESCSNLKTFFSDFSGVDLLREEPEEVSLEDYIIDVNPLFDKKLGFRNLEHLKLSEFPTLEEKVGNAQVPIGLFYNLKSLVLDVFLGTSSAIPSSLLSAFKNLETLEVRSCGSLKKVFDMDTQQNADGHTLKKTNQEALDFNSLKSLKVYNCCNLRCIFTPSIISGLAQLQKIEVKNCALIEEIIMKEEEKEAHIEEIRIPQLNSIDLESLPNLTSFCLGINNLECPALKAITVAKCPKIETFIFTDMKHQSDHIAPIFSKKVGFRKFEHLKLCEFVTLKENIWNGKVPIDLFCNLKSLVLDELSDIPSNVLSYFKNVEKIEAVFPTMDDFTLSSIITEWIWQSQLPAASSCFQELTILVIDGLDHLKYFFCSSMVRSLFNLKELEISNCKLIEGIIVEDEERTSTMLFPKLDQLKLRDLPKLTTFCSSTGNFIELSSLFRLWIENCPGMKSFISNSIWSDMTSTRKFEERNSNENLHAHMQSLFDKKVAFPSLEKMILLHLDNLQLIWHDQLHGDSFSKLKEVIPNLEWLGLNADNITSRCLDHIPARSFRKLKFFGLVGFRKFEHLNLCEFLTLKENIWNGKLPIDLFCNLKSLVLDGLSDIATIIPSNVLSYFKNVETIEVKNYDSLKEVFDMEEQLDYGDGLSAKRSHHEILGFRNLKSLKVDNCNNLRYIFTASLASSLVQLEQIEIKSCALVEEIITKKGEKDAGIDKIKIPLLKSISLESLPNLTSFYSGSNILECPPLKNIIIKDCQNIHLKDFSLHLPSLFSENVVFPTMDDLTSSSIITEWIWQSQLPATSSCFEKLTILVIDGFDHLKYFFSSSMVKSLFELKELEISNCKLIEEIIVEDEERTSTMLFPKLYQLKLRDLPKLTTFCSSTGNFVELSSLFGLWIDNCPGMKSFVSISKWNDKTSTKKLEETNSNENLHAHMQSPFFDKKGKTPLFGEIGNQSCR
ncbi:hypothetical protein Patl1_06994 [Pistacia atlantica]|uniref:Uncharacterized protein n=1 Tax=Pistacia atlantica TaxID=434234 RepID=A0ACC1AIK2_9ROSI|nr:hypothetical protein Patl1_06994 [Pistacia atlantica]